MVNCCERRALRRRIPPPPPYKSTPPPKTSRNHAKISSKQITKITEYSPNTKRPKPSNRTDSIPTAMFSFSNMNDTVSSLATSLQMILQAHSTVLFRRDPRSNMKSIRSCVDRFFQTNMVSTQYVINLEGDPQNTLIKAETNFIPTVSLI